MAVANGIFVAATVYFHQHDYPLRLLGVQVFIVFAALVLASKNRWIRGIGFFLTLIGILCTFSALLLYAPTFIAVVWTLDAVQKRELQSE